MQGVIDWTAVAATRDLQSSQAGREVEQGHTLPALAVTTSVPPS